MLIFFLFALQGFAEIHGTLIADGGQAITSPMLVQLRTGAVTVKTTLTDTTGRFHFEFIRPGSYVIYIDEKGFQEVEESLELFSGARTIHLLMLRAPTSIRRTAPQATHIVDLRQLAIPGKAIDQYEKALAEIQKDRTGTAVERLKNALKIAPDYYDANLQLGLQYLKSNEMSQAEVHLIRAAELNPRVAQPLIALGLLYLCIQKPAEAGPVLERAIDLDPRSPRGTYYLGIATAQRGNVARAATLLRRALELDPQLHPARAALEQLRAAQTSD